MGEIMKCVNCKMPLPNSTDVCPNCGYVFEKNDGYVLLSNEAEKPKQNIEYAKPKRRGVSGFVFYLITVLLAVAVGIGSFMYFSSQYETMPQPELEFFAGYGVVNGDEQVVYVSVKDASKIEFIHGVTCYDKNMYSMQKDANVVSSDYKYSKNVDKSFRTVFFDMKDLNVESGKNYTYTFEIKFSFYGDENIYTYYQPINFVGSTKIDVGEIVFDHTKQDTKKPEAVTSENVVKQTTQNILQSAYWFSKPTIKETGYSIYSFKFEKNGVVTKTIYTMELAQPWKTTTVVGNYTIKEDRAVLKFDNAKNNATVEVDKDTNELFSFDTNLKQKKAQYTAREFNTVKVAKKFFGLA